MESFLDNAVPEEHAGPNPDTHQVVFTSGATVWARKNKGNRFFPGTIAFSQANSSNSTIIVDWEDGSQSAVDKSNIMVRIPNAMLRERSTLANENAVNLSNRKATSILTQRNIPPPR
jgi:hypothetical protein